MRLRCLASARRRNELRITVPNAKAACRLDGVNRQFKAQCPNRLWVADFTCVSIRYSARLAYAGMKRSVGSTGNSCGNALADTINGLYEAEIIHRCRPWTAREAVELATPSSTPNAVSC